MVVRVTAQIAGCPHPAEDCSQKGDVLLRSTRTALQGELGRGGKPGLAAAAGKDRALAEAAVEMRLAGFAGHANSGAAERLFLLNQNQHNGRLLKPGDQVNGRWEHPALIGWVAIPGLGPGVRFDMDERELFCVTTLTGLRKCERGRESALRRPCGRQAYSLTTGMLVSLTTISTRIRARISVPALRGPREAYFSPGMSARVRVAVRQADPLAVDDGRSHFH